MRTTDTGVRWSHSRRCRAPEDLQIMEQPWKPKKQSSSRSPRRDRIRNGLLGKQGGASVCDRDPKGDLEEDLPIGHPTEFADDAFNASDPVDPQPNDVFAPAEKAR